MLDNRSTGNSESEVAALADRVATARGKLPLQSDPALFAELSEAEIAAERKLAEWMRTQRRAQRRRALTAELAAEKRDRRVALALRRADDDDARWHRRALASRRRASNADARLAQLYRRAEWSSRALIGVVVLGMLWAGVNVQHNLVPSGNMADPLYWLSYGFEAMISIPIITIMVVATTAARWGREIARGKVVFLEAALLGVTIALNAGPHLASGALARAAEAAVAPVMVGVVIWLHAWVSARYAQLIDAIPVDVQAGPDDPAREYPATTVEFGEPCPTCPEFATDTAESAALPIGHTFRPDSGQFGMTAGQFGVAGAPFGSAAAQSAPAAPRNPATEHPGATAGPHSAAAEPSGTTDNLDAPRRDSASAGTEFTTASNQFDTGSTTPGQSVNDRQSPDLPRVDTAPIGAQAAAAHAEPAPRLAAPANHPQSSTPEPAMPATAGPSISEQPNGANSIQRASRTTGQHPYERRPAPSIAPVASATTITSATPAEQATTAAKLTSSKLAAANAPGTSANPAATTEPATLAEHTTPATSAAPSTAAAPATPAAMIAPGSSAATAEPATPAGTTDSTDPAPAATGTEPSAPAATVAPVAPAATSDSTVPSTTVEPATPAAAIHPIAPAAPAEPSPTPARPAERGTQLSLDEQPAPEPAARRPRITPVSNPITPRRISRAFIEPVDDPGAPEAWDDSDPIPAEFDDAEVWALAREIADRRLSKLPVEQLAEVLTLAEESWTPAAIGASIGLPGSRILGILDTARRLRGPYAISG